jgi:hypothetical protein
MQKIEPASSLPGCTADCSGEGPFSVRERQQITALNRALVQAFNEPGGSDEHKNALRVYLRTMTFLGRRYRMFEIANHRVFKAGDALIVPYDAHGELAIYSLQGESERLIRQLRLPHGTLVTDALIAELTGIEGAVVDLEREIYHLEIDDMPAIKVARLRDLAGLLHRLNACGSRHEAVYLLRFLVARLCSSTQRGMPGAKNLRPEIRMVRDELVEFMNGPFAVRLRLPARILVRSISGLVSTPKLIDEVWQDTIDLAEVHVRGSAITNEIRRSTHHAMGKRTLDLSRSYLKWLETGQADFPDAARLVPGPADEVARSQGGVRELVARIVAGLEQLLGTSQIAQRLLEWRDAYSSELMRCDATSTLGRELESLVERGVRGRNRWVYQHRLSVLKSKLRGGRWTVSARRPFEASLRLLEDAQPDRPDFAAEEIESAARSAVDAFAAQIRRDHQDPLFDALDDLLERYENGSQFEAFEQSCGLRRQLESLAGAGIFPSQRYLLDQLDCLLEELGFFALRHIASGYMERGVDLEQCLRIVHLCAGNLDRDGLFSRELWDLSVMLVNPERSPSELLDVLAQIQRNYHRLINRVSEAYEVMSGRLGYSGDEMRAVLANFQRTMHDLNSLVHFSDLARGYISERGGDLRWAGKGAAGGEPWDFVHLSNIRGIVRRVESRTSASLQARYGGKGSGLIYIAYLGIPTRDGFIIPTVLPRLGLHDSARERFEREVLKHVRLLERNIARAEGSRLHFGDPKAPLLLAVRGGSPFSMPGMLATVVFVGMTDAVAETLALDDEWYAWDAYRRFLVSYASAVWELDLEALDLVEKAKRDNSAALKTQLSGSAMREVVESTKDAIREAGFGERLDAILSDVELQLHSALRAVYASWKRERASRYRAIKHLSDGWHTAAIVQQMASGNRSNKDDSRPGMDETRISLTGVIPKTCMQETGFRAFTGDVKFSACGDDLVGGLTTAKSFEPVQRLHSLAPMLERKLNHISARLRRFFGTDAEIEFTVDRGVLSVLQARSAQVEVKLSTSTFKSPGLPAGRGIGISGGAYRGLVAFDEADVERLAEAAHGRSAEVDGVLLVLENPTPDEIPLILSVGGLLSARGGSTSHAAVAVHGIEGAPYNAVLGVAELKVAQGEATLLDAAGRPSFTIRAGDVVSIHGRTGELFIGPREVIGVARDDATELPAPDGAPPAEARAGLADRREV